MNKKLGLNLFWGFLMLILLFATKPLNASLLNNKNDVVGLLVMDRLFANDFLLGEAPSQLNQPLTQNRILTNQSALQSGLGLGDLLVLDKLFSSNSLILNQEKTTLGDLLILDQLFANQPLLTKNKTHPGLGLGELFVLDRLFRDTNQSLLMRGQTSLGDLFLLAHLFN